MVKEIEARMVGGPRDGDVICVQSVGGPFYIFPSNDIVGNDRLSCYRLDGDVLTFVEERTLTDLLNA